jgi:uncharacterized membrane protein YkgB
VMALINKIVLLANQYLTTHFYYFKCVGNFVLKDFMLTLQVINARSAQCSLAVRRVSMI